jgi:hypothetical protein
LASDSAGRGTSRRSSASRSRRTPAFLVRLEAVLKIDGVEVARGTGEAPGLDQRVRIDLSSPATGVRRVDHGTVVGGVYAFALDPGRVPDDLVAERLGRAEDLAAGDDREAERLYAAGLVYLKDLGASRDEIAGLSWHRVVKEAEETMAAVADRVCAKFPRRPPQIGPAHA